MTAISGIALCVAHLCTLGAAPGLHATVINSELPGPAHRTKFGYDADGLLTSAGALTITRAAATGFVTGTSLGAVTTTETLNGFGDLASFTAGVSGSPVYETSAMTYDRAGRLVGALETIEGTTTGRDFAYDRAGRLTDVWENGTLTEHYAYDANGNRTSAAVRGVPSAGTYDDQDRIVTYGSQTFAFNDDGQLVSRTNTATGATTSYDYDELGNLLAVALPDGRLVEYVIDPFGRRIAKKVDGVMTRRWLWDGQLRIVAELDGAGTLVSRFVYGTKVNVPEYMVRGGVTFRIISDRLGTVRLVVNTATGAVVQRLDYDSFGALLADTSPSFQPFGFAGGLCDPDTALVRFGARDYDAATGRWTARDPILFAGGDTNLYAYVSSDPLNRADPRGNNPIFLLPWLIVGGVAALVDIYFTGEQTLEDAARDPTFGDRVPGESSDRPGQRGDKGGFGAYRHCLWTCRLSQHAFGLGGIYAQGAGLLELGSDSASDSGMDLDNNVMGQFATCTESTGATSTPCEQSCGNLYQEDRLTTLVPFNAGDDPLGFF